MTTNNTFNAQNEMIGQNMTPTVTRSTHSSGNQYTINPMEPLEIAVATAKLQRQLHV